MWITTSIVIIATMLKIVVNEEVDQPSRLLGPRNYNHHAYHVADYFEDLQQPEPTRPGPVLFPNDAPPPPRPPLIVTSRPLAEQVARSELSYPQELNNSIAEQTQVNRVQIPQPNFLARLKQYQPFNYVTPSPTPVILVDAVTGKPVYSGNYDYVDTSGSDADYKHPYADVVKKSRLSNAGFVRDHRYNDYEEQTVLPPIYKALSQHANNKVLKINQNKQQRYNNKYEVKEPVYTNDYYANNVDNNGGESTEYAQGKKYAFSYSVKDQKTGDDFSHSQHSSGQATNGEYRVRLPDGRMQIVSYIADENGYKADVRYDVEHEDKTADNTIEPNNNYNNDYKETKQPINHDYYNQYSDLSKEYYNDDYSIEYPTRNYKDFTSNQRKFAPFDRKAVTNKERNVGVIYVPNEYKVSTVKPSYKELKPIFVTKQPYQAQSNQDYLYSKIPVELNVPSTTGDPLAYEQGTTERVVLIGGAKSPLYTNIRSSLPPISPTASPTPLYDSITPNFLLSSTQSPLSKNVNISNNKVTLSSSFIDRINRYLSFT